MPLFSSRHSTESTSPTVSEKQETTAPHRSSTLFSRRRSVSPTNTTSTRASTVSHNSQSSHRNFLHRRNEDPSIVAARERVQNAEAMEKDADRALMHARAAVKEAREHVLRVEREAAEEARLAKIKQDQAASISKRARPLGRHDQVV